MTFLAKPTRITRRDVLRTGAGGAAGLALPLAACGGGASSASFEITELGDGLALIAGAGGNVVAARGPDGLVLVDGGTAEHASDLIRAAGRAVGARDLAVLFNTHWHHEQTGANEAAGRGGARIIAHENTRLWLTQHISRPWEERTFEPYPDVALPNDTFYDRGELALGDERVEYGYLTQAHTDGDIYVFFREANVLVTGGVLSGDRWPTVDWWTGGWIGGAGATLNANAVPVYGGMVGGLQRLLELADEETRIIPADGPVLDRAELAAQAEALAGVADELRGMLFSALSPAEAVAQNPTAGFKPEWGDPSEFVTLAFQSLWAHYTPDA